MKLNVKQTILVGMAFMSICTFWQLYDNIIPLILRNTFKVSDTIAGAILALDNVLALFMLPLFGSLSDKTKSPLGRRTPYILIGTIAASVSMVLLPIADNIKSLWVFMLSLLFVLISMSTYRSPAVALMPDLTPKPLRSKANAIINLMGAVGGMISLVLIAFLIPKNVMKPNYIPLFAVVAGIMIICVVILKLTIPEKKLSDEMAKINQEEENSQVDVVTTDEKMPKEVRRSLIFLLCSVAFWFMGYNAITSAFSKYAQVYWGLQGGGFAKYLMVSTVAAILSYIPVGTIATKIGRKKTILFGVAVLALCFIVGGLFKTFTPFINIIFALVGVSWAAINVNSYPMVVEMGKGNNVGKFTGFYYTFSMSAQIVTPILSGFLLQHVGYWTLFPYAAVFVSIAFFTMLFVKHGDSRPVGPKNKLEAFDIAD